MTAGNIERAPEMLELAAGVAWWREDRGWPADFHNADYAIWLGENPHGDFTLQWWKPFLKRLTRWKATRKVSGRVLTERFTEQADALREAWRVACEPFVESDISEVEWEQVAAFPIEVAKIKPTRSPVFTSKFCHFLLPRVFPVVDGLALGNRQDYEANFRSVQDDWARTPPPMRSQLADQLRVLIEAMGADVFHAFPMTNKIVELRRIGRRHPTIVRPSD